eukprot:GGOE01036378.1.p1 GENE.GGOE01036378.1~~GGOE01036378.1.p1  ORF type:complete len:552 (-),score=161.43 GGOE01036378.1:307-1962(-)
MPSKRSRVEKWNDVLESYEKFEKFRESRESKLKSWVRKGIPVECKGRAWQFLSGSPAAKIPGKFEQLVDARITDEQTAAISVDLPRTFPKNPHFQQPAERERMRRVLHAYAAYDQAVGYVQGMAFVSGALLFYMSEEDAFWVLSMLMHKYNYHNALIQDFPFVRLCLAQLKHVIKKFTPTLHVRLHQNGPNSCVPVELFSGAFVALLADCVPWELFTRVWDSFFFEEWKTIFRLIVALLQNHERQLIIITDDGELIGSMKIAKLANGLDVCQLMQRAFQVKLRSRTLYRVCKRYNRDKFEEWLKQLDFQALSMQMQNAEKGVEISDRTLYLRKHQACFVASQAVDWLVDYFDQGKLTLHCGLCHPVGMRSPKPAAAIASIIPGFTGLTMTVDLTSKAPGPAAVDIASLTVPTSADLRSRHTNSSTSLSHSQGEKDSEEDDEPVSRSPPSRKQNDHSEEKDLEDEDEEDDEWEQSSLCWCRSQLGTNTAYYNRYIQDNKAKIETIKRKKAMVILTAMEQRGHIHSVKGNDDPITDDSGRYFRFGKATTPGNE